MARKTLDHKSFLWRSPPCYNRCFWKCNLWPITSGPAKCPLRKLAFIFCPLHMIFKSFYVFSKMKIVCFVLRGYKYGPRELKAGTFGVTFTFFGQNYVVHHWAFYNCSQSFEIRLQKQYFPLFHSRHLFSLTNDCG